MNRLTSVLVASTALLAACGGTDDSSAMPEMTAEEHAQHLAGGNQGATDSTGAQFTLAETDLYVGSEQLARDVNGNFTVAPGQYPTIHDSLNGAVTDNYTVTDLSGAIYVVAHAVVTIP